MTQKTRTTAAAKAPVSAHPAFPTIVALWFAALLGIGSLVLPTVLFERASEATGLSSIIVAAQPPLGVTARIVIALVAAGIGVFSGLTIAGRVKAAHTPHASPQRSSAALDAGKAAPKRPISALEELGPYGLDAKDAKDTIAPIDPSGATPSVTDDSAGSELPETESHPGLAPYVPASELEDRAMSAETEAAEPLEPEFFDDASARDAVLNLASRSEDERSDTGFGDLESIQPCGRAALDAAPASDSPFDDAGFWTRPMNIPTSVPAIESAEDQPVAELSPHSSPAQTATAGKRTIVELVDRFARALERHRAEVPKDATVFQSAGAETSGIPPRAPQAMPVPASLKPFCFDHEDEEDDGVPSLDLSLSLAQSAHPLAEGAQPLPPFAESEDADEEADEGVAKEGYSSLLAIRSPFGAPRETILGDDAAPGAARSFDDPLDRLDALANPFQTDRAKDRTGAAQDSERALREALEKLQRLSGAA